MSAPLTQDSEPGWFRRLNRVVARLGLWRATAALASTAIMLTAALTQLAISVAGHGDQVMVLICATLCSIVLAPPAGYLVARLVLELERTHKQLDLLATHDELMGVYTRRHFMAVVQREWDRARRYNTPAALLLIDADHFKRINDEHGQLCGDQLLRSVAKAVRESLRQADVLARFGGEQLIVFLPHTDPLGALDVAERVRERVQVLSVQGKTAAPVSITVSVGMAPMRPELPSLDWMIHEADTALYAAKADGRNRVRTLPFEPSRNGGAFETNPR